MKKGTFETKHVVFNGLNEKQFCLVIFFLLWNVKCSEKKINLKSFFHLSTFNDVERELPGLRLSKLFLIHHHLCN